MNGDPLNRKAIRLVIVDQSDFVQVPLGGSTTFLRTVVPHLSLRFELLLVGFSAEDIPMRQPVRGYLGDAVFLPIDKIGRLRSLIPSRLHTLLSLFLFRRQIERFRPDIWYFHQVDAAVPLTSVQGFRCLHLHGLTNPLAVSRFKLLRSPFFYKLFQIAYSRVEKNMDLIISVSHPSDKAEHELKIDRPEIVHVIPVAVDTELFKPGDKERARQRLGLPSAQVVLGYVGRIGEKKGLGKVARAMAFMVREGIDVRLLVVGDGEYAGELGTLVSGIGIADRVTFFGQVKYAQLPEYYSAMDVFVLASEAEGFPMCLVEAAACGLPMLATDVGAVATIIKPGRNGYLVNFDDQGQVASAVISVMSDYGKFSIAARESSRSHSGKHIAGLIANALTKGANEKSSQGV